MVCDKESVRAVGLIVRALDGNAWFGTTTRQKIGENQPSIFKKIPTEEIVREIFKRHHTSLPKWYSLHSNVSPPLLPHIQTNFVSFYTT